MRVNSFEIVGNRLDYVSMSDQHDFDHLKELLCFNVYALNRAFSRFYQSAFAETGLTYPKFVILKSLNTDGPSSVSELSERASVEPNSLSPILKKMASFDLITRTRSTEDERRVDIAITPKGQAVLKRADEVIMRGFAELGLDEARMVEALAFLEDTKGRVDVARPPKLDLDGIV